MTNDTAFVLIIFGGMNLFAAVVTIYDWLAQRQQRREREREQRRSA